MESLVVDLELLAPVEEDAGKRPVEVVEPLDSRDLESTHRVKHAVGSDRKTRGAQHARKMHYVFRKAARHLFVI